MKAQQLTRKKEEKPVPQEDLKTQDSQEMTNKRAEFARRDVFVKLARKAKIKQNTSSKRGYKIIQTNWTCQIGEVDIVAQGGDNVVLVEVKTRRTLNKDDSIMPER